MCCWGGIEEFTARRGGTRVAASPSEWDGSWTEYGGGGRLFIVAMAAARAAIDSLAPRSTSTKVTNERSERQQDVEALTPRFRRDLDSRRSKPAIGVSRQQLLGQTITLQWELAPA